MSRTKRTRSITGQLSSRARFRSWIGEIWDSKITSVAECRLIVSATSSNFPGPMNVFRLPAAASTADVGTNYCTSRLGQATQLND